MDPVQSTQRENVAPPAKLQSHPGDVSWVTADSVVDQMVNEGVRVRIKVDKPQFRKRGGVVCEESQSKRCILSLAGGGLRPGRRIAEVQARVVDSPDLIEQMEILNVTVWGVNRSLLGRERLFDGNVSTRDDALTVLQELAAPQILGKAAERES